MPALLLELRQAFQNRHGFTRSANGLAEFIALWFLNPVKRLVSCLEVAKGLLRGALGDFVVLTMLGFNLGYQPLVEVNAGRDLLSLVKRFLTLGYTPITGMTRYAGVFVIRVACRLVRSSLILSDFTGVKIVITSLIIKLLTCFPSHNSE